MVEPGEEDTDAFRHFCTGHGHDNITVVPLVVGNPKATWVL